MEILRKSRPGSGVFGRRGISAGAITSQEMACWVNARCNSKPHGPAS